MTSSSLNNAMQLPLSLQLRDDASFSNFVVGSNAQALDYLRNIALGLEKDTSTYMWGMQGTGKTHLLQAMCQLASQHDRSAIYVSLADEDISAELLEGFEQLNLICFDDIEAVIGDRKWETALFNLYNWSKQTGAQLVFAATDNYQSLHTCLPDLKSRFGAGVNYRLQELNDEDKHTVLQSRSKNRGFDMSDAVATFLLKTYPRNMKSLLAIIDELDVATLSAQRKLSIPFVKSWMDAKSSD